MGKIIKIFLSLFIIFFVFSISVFLIKSYKINFTFYCDEIVFPINIFEEKFVNENFEFVILSRRNKEVGVVRYLKEYEREVDIPSCIFYDNNYFKVTRVCENAFLNNKNLIKVNISKNIQLIEINAFKDCINLEYVTFSSESTLKIIEMNAFYNTNIKKIFLPKTLKVICTQSFCSCNKLKVLSFEKESELKYIGYGAFMGCDIKRKVNMNTKVYVSKNSFYNEKKLEEYEQNLKRMEKREVIRNYMNIKDRNSIIYNCEKFISYIEIIKSNIIFLFK